jgi:RNA polymerase sigma-70 factor, ECF subfamily
MSDDAPGTSPSDPLRVLVGRAVDRDPDAWEQLYRRSYRNLFGFARRRLFDDQLAEDAVSETMTRALDNIDRFTWQGGGFDAWLYGIARNVVYELTRVRQRTAPLHEVAQPTTERGPEEHAVANDESTAMRLAFDRLDAEDREILELRVHAGLTSDEVGRLLGKQPGTVRMAQARALQRLRVILEEVGHGN